METKWLYGELYFMLIIDDYTKMMAASFLKKKSKAFKCFNIYKEMVENEMDLKLKCLILDNSWEFTSKSFQWFFEEHGINR